MNVRMEPAVSTPRRSGAGLTGAGGVVLLLLVSGTGAVIDVVSGPGLRRIFAVSLVVGAALAALAVRRSGLWAVVISAPLVFVTFSVITTYAGDSRPETMGDFVNYLVTWLVYGFPEIAAATGAALLIAGVRLIRR